MFAIPQYRVCVRKEKHKPGGWRQERYEMKVVLVEHAGCTLPCHVEKMIPHDQT